MKPYGRRNPLRFNFEDCHPQKGMINWWEYDIPFVDSKKADRQKAKKEIRKCLIEVYNESDA